MASVYGNPLSGQRRNTVGNISNVMNHYFSHSRRFADLFNGVCFQGEGVVKAEELSEASEVYHEVTTKDVRTKGRGKRAERIRDVCKTMKTGGMLRILALENQELIDYAMPFRCMQYDTMEYGKQLNQLKKKNSIHYVCIMEQKSGTVQDRCGIWWTLEKRGSPFKEFSTTTPCAYIVSMSYKNRKH